MEKQKKWQLFLIIAVIALTLYNIFPTLFYYAQPLKKEITESKAEQIAQSIADRTNSLEEQSLSWLHSFVKHIDVKAEKIVLQENSPELITIQFRSSDDMQKFKKHFPKAGHLIPFVPSQLTLYPEENATNTLTIQRRIPIHFNEATTKETFHYVSKFDSEGKISSSYQDMITDRILNLGVEAGGANSNAQIVSSQFQNLSDSSTQDALISLSQNIISYTQAFGESSDVAKRYFSTFTQVEAPNRFELVNSLLKAIETYRDQLKTEKITLEQEKAEITKKGSFLDTVKQQRLDLVTKREKTLFTAGGIVRRNQTLFASGKNPWTYKTFRSKIIESKTLSSSKDILAVSLDGRHPMIKEIVVDLTGELINLKLYPQLEHITNKLAINELSSKEKRQVQLLFDEIASLSRTSGENITPNRDQFEIAIHKLSDSHSFLLYDLSSIAKAQIQDVQTLLSKQWKPLHPDLKAENFPVYDYETYNSLPLEKKQLCFVIYSPSLYEEAPPRGFKMNSIYIVAKGLDKLVNRSNTNNEQMKQLIADFNDLKGRLETIGFFGFSASSLNFGTEFVDDTIFAMEDYYNTVLKASREEFEVLGTKRYAILNFTNRGQRILTENRIDDEVHEELLRWRDDYHAAQLEFKGTSPYDVPTPTVNPLWSNFKLSCKKYFRGDERKVLRWGLDLSGGKTVQLELIDQNNQIVTNEDDLKQGTDELYRRVNKMGVSEVSIRREGNFITLDFPGSQSLSAADLVQASSMYFNIVNEKFSVNNLNLREYTNKFLQEVWNEAVVTGRKTEEDINQIAWKHLYGDSLDSDVVHPRSEAAEILYENGLRLASTEEMIPTNSNFNETYSKVAIYRGDDFTEWYGQTHPLLITFRNFACEGSNLDDVIASYDPTKGNYLSFNIKSSASKEGQRTSPRDDLHAWTSIFSKENIQGTPNEIFSRGNGWRMAIILNGSVISAPPLEGTLRENGMISGSFTQREINQLESDLKAGSLTYTPRILSEKNVSPELGQKERFLGILATIIALGLVILTMVGYYRFAGLIASIAVIFNLLIMWAALQNIQASLSLAAIAGIILTVGMAVDANVLVFERIREEFTVSGRIASAVKVGYKKAFSAIFDSNITTIIAALILFQFDSGPIKGFAITLIIGIASSMFSALFMTRYFFLNWVQNPKNKQLKMCSWIKASSFDFLKRSKYAIFISAAVLITGTFFLSYDRNKILGMDFTGGYALTVELEAKQGVNYREIVENALIQSGIFAQDFQIRELTPSNHLRLFLSKHIVPLDLESNESGINPRIAWIYNTLNSADVPIAPNSIQKAEKTWSEVSGQMSTSMRNSAAIGLGLALVAILIYITIRFEFKYAISATLCIIHDVFFALSAIAILYTCGVPVQIDMHTVAALMTIIGYSLNDTIIVFDRIREDTRLKKNQSFREIINFALNTTLSRTLMTSITTFLVLVPLVVLGGSTVFGFSLVMAIGVIFGTLSSLFIAAPLIQYFHDREIRQTEKLSLNQPNQR